MVSGSEDENTKAYATRHSDDDDASLGNDAKWNIAEAVILLYI
jgi:hypothetical protein